MSALPTDLSEILGVAPLYHLVPKQDLTPLASINSIRPQAINPKDHISDATTHLVEDLEKDYDDLPQEKKDSFASFAAKFKEFQDPELDRVTFKRPVIAADGGKVSGLGKLPSLYDVLKSDDDVVSESAIRDLDTNLDVSSIAGDNLDILQDLDDLPKIESHIKDYRDRLSSVIACNSKKRLAKSEYSSVAPKKKIAYDQAISSAIREKGLNDVLDTIDLENISLEEIKHHSKYIMLRDGQVSLSPFALNEIRKIYSEYSNESESLSPSQRFKIQKLCVKTITVSKLATVTELYDSIQACTVLLQILNSSMNDRQLHLDSFIDAIVTFLQILVDRVKQSEQSLELQKEILACLDAFSAQVRQKAIDERHITKLEYLCISAIATKPINDEFDNMKVIFVDFLAHIFKYYASQREFIIDELLFNLKDISAHNLDNQTRLSSGISVSFTCVLLLRLIQSFGLQDLEKEISSFLKSATGVPSKTVVHQRRLQLLEVIHSKFQEATKSEEQIADFIHNSLSILDQESKQILITMIKDLVMLAPLPEWPGAEGVLATIISKLVSEMMSNNVPANHEPMILDMAGVFGVEYLKSKFHDGTESNLNSHNPENLAAHKEVLNYLKIQRSVPISENSEFQFQLMKSINYYGSLMIDFEKAHPNQLENSKGPGSFTECLDELLSFSANRALIENVSTSSELGSATRKSYRLILMSGSYPALYEKFVTLLKVSLESPRAKVTAKAIKVLSRIIEVEPKILLKMKINQSVSRLLTGKSALSRDAVIDLLADYMFTSEELTKTYYKSVGEMSDDESISVRKRVAKIMREAYLKVEDIPVKAYAFEKLLRRLHDQESSFAGVIRSNLLSLLFSKPNPKINTEVMVEALKQGTQVRHFLKNFIDQALESDDSKRSRNKAIQGIVSYILDEALVDDESTITSTEALQVVNVLVQCDRTLITQDQLVSLQPYFMDGSSESNRFHALKITRLALSTSRIMRPDFSSTTLELLFKRLTKFETKELHEAVQVIELLSAGSDNSGLAKATISSMKLLWPQVARTESSGFKEITKTCKLLQLLGCFGSYCDFQNYNQVFLRSDIGLKPNETIVSLITRYLIFFCQPVLPVKVRVCAEKSLISVASYNPQMFLSETVLKTLDEELRSGPVSIKLAIVSGLTRYLSKESEGVEQKSPDDPERSKDRFLGVESQSLNDSVCAGIVQRYTPIILDLCVMDCDESGELCVFFIQLVMKLGYANPKVCVPTILALQASPNPKIRRAGAELHADVFDKHESLADRSYVEAVSLAAKYIQRTGDIQQSVTFLESVYNVIRRTYSARKKFILSLAKLFSIDISAKSLQAAVDQRDRTVFLALNFSRLRFDSSEEVFLLVYHLDRSITKEGLDISEKITTTIGSQAGDGMSLSNLQLLFVYSQSILALIYLRQYLASAYGVGAFAMETFRPSRADPELRQQPKLVHLVEYPLANLELSTKLSEPASFGPIFTRMVQCAREYTT